MPACRRLLLRGRVVPGPTPKPERHRRSFLVLYSAGLTGVCPSLGSHCIKSGRVMLAG